MRIVALVALFLVQSAFCALDPNSVPDADAIVLQVTDLSYFDFQVAGNCTPVGIHFANPQAVQYASFCGFNASAIACNPCQAGSTIPSWTADCSSSSDPTEREVVYGQPTLGGSNQAGFHTLPTRFPAVGQYNEAGILVGQFDFLNYPITASTSPDYVDMQTDVQFINPATSALEADFSFVVRLWINDGLTCSGMGCPWNDPSSWINDQNPNCVNGALPDGTACCKFITQRNPGNECADQVLVSNQWGENTPIITVNGTQYQLWIDGFHMDPTLNPGLILLQVDHVVPYFLAVPDAKTRVNMHISLIPLTVACAAGTKTIRLANRNQCNCTTVCDSPASLQPDCTCMEKLEKTFRCHATCGQPCGAGQYRTGPSSNCVCRNIPCTCSGPANDMCHYMKCIETQTGTAWYYTDNWSCVKQVDDSDSRCNGQPQAVCNQGQCQSGNCVTNIPFPNDPRCPPSPTALCHKQGCVGNKCSQTIIWDADTRCNGQFYPTAPNGQQVQPQCYPPSMAFCVPGAGQCNPNFLASNGNAGGLDNAHHPGTCAVPSNYDATCAWPYCDQNGQCATDVFNGSPYPNYNPNYRPGYTCPTPATVNPQCWFPRCINGVCGGDAWNFGLPCTPMPSEVDTVHNAQCIDYVCGSGATAGTCISINKPGGRLTPCVDNILCSWDWCGGSATAGDGQCDDHQWKQCGTPEGVCVTSTCDPATGDCTAPVRNGDACCPNNEINTGEECEPGLNGADSQCCVGCLLSSGPCTDNNPCTADACQNGRCVSTFQAGACTGPANDTCALYQCTANSDPTIIATCERKANLGANGQACGTKPNQCSVMVCDKGTCTQQPDSTMVGKPCTDGPAPSTCMKNVCSAAGTCDAVADLTQSCPNADNSLCTAEKCVLNGKVASCQVVSTVTCNATKIPQCFAAGVCDPTTGQCPPLTPLSNIPCTNGTKSSDARGTTCSSFTCEKGVCVVNCTCGNGKLDAGEQCDWAIPSQSKCCSGSCQGCLCGNGKLDEGEQCDYNIPSQSACCNSSCLGCLCGNGQLDGNETCDPAIPNMAACCNNATCQGCAPVVHTAIGSSVAIAVSTVAAAAIVVGAAAAIYAMGAAGGAGAVAAGGAAGSGAGVGGSNPLYAPSTSTVNNLIYEPAST